MKCREFPEPVCYADPKCIDRISTRWVFLCMMLCGPLPLSPTPSTPILGCLSYLLFNHPKSLGFSKSLSTIELSPFSHHHPSWFVAALQLFHSVSWRSGQVLGAFRISRVSSSVSWAGGIFIVNSLFYSKRLETHKISVSRSFLTSLVKVIYNRRERLFTLYFFFFLQHINWILKLNNFRVSWASCNSCVPQCW